MNRLVDKHLKEIIIFVVLIILVYVVYVMYSLPYMTMDEVEWISRERLDRLTSTINMGRPSQYIMALTTYVTQFEKPYLINMTPRLLAVLLMLYSLFKYVKTCGLSGNAAVIYIAFFTLTHQLDWQHNGMLAFFSIFCVYIGAFLYAINDENWAVDFSYARTILFIISFGNELFLILSMMLVAYNLLVEKRGLEKAREILLALIISAVLYAYHLLFKSIPDGMQNYLFGSIDKFTILEMIYSGSLYYVYSIPFMSELLRGDYRKMMVIFFTLLFSFVYIFNCWIINRGINNKKFYYLAILFVVAILPQFLMSAQPMKVEWILNDSSHRYAFSLYGWIFISFIIFNLIYFLFKKGGQIVKVILSLGTIYFVIISAFSNIKFVHQYEKSLASWRAIAGVENLNKEYIELPRDLLVHPYILPVQDYHVENYVMNNFGKKIKFLDEGFYPASLESGINFSVNGLPSFIKSVKGLSVAEPFGRWSDANLHPNVEINFKDKLPKNFTLKIVVSSYYPNHNEILKISIGNSVRFINYVENNNSMTLYEVPFSNVDSDSIILITPKSISPKDFNSESSDDRKIGFAIGSLHISPL
jgi:hypothetical protein